MRSLIFPAAFLACLLWGATASAQDLDFEFTPEETSSGVDDGELTFEVVDTAKEAAKVEEDRKAEIDLIRVIQRRPFLRRKRVEIAPSLGTNINDALVSIFVAGGALNYHLSEVMSIGLSGTYSLGTETDLFDRVIEDYELFPEISKVRWSASLDFQYAFMYGKFALFNTWIIPWDTYGVLGAGVTQTELAVHPSLSMGLGQRYFMNRWFTLNLELRDNVYNEDYPGGSSIVNNILFTTGVSFFIPPDFEYRTLK
jgi:outer membrane beta-barrel protein